MESLAFLLIILIFLLMASYILCDRDMMAPDVLYIAGFVLAVIAASMNVSAWGIDLSAKTIMIILIGTLSFVSVGMLYRLSHKKYKGVIPWDDDMDFVMTRHNYERFLEACEVDLQEQFEVVNWRSNSNYGNGFTKIMLKGTEAIEEGKENVQYPHCIFVDVFPFDNIPDSRLKQLYQKWTTYFCIRMIQQKEGSIRKYNSTKKKMAYSILKCLSHGFSADFLIRVCEKEMSRYKNCQTNQMTSMTGYYGYGKRKN